MTVDPTKVPVEFMVMKRFKKEDGYDVLMKKLYDKAKKAKAKNLTANIQVSNTKFTPGAKGKPPVPLIDNSKIKVVKKGPQADKVVVVATEGDAKMKTLVIALRFATQDGAKLFYETSKMKGVKPQTPPPAPPTPASATRSPTPKSVRTPEHTYENTRSGGITPVGVVPTPQPGSRREPPSRSMSRSETSRYSPTPSLQPVGRKYEMSERHMASTSSHSPVKHAERTQTPSISETPDRRSRSQQQGRQSHFSSRSTSSSSSSSRPMPPPADSRNGRKKSKSRSPSRLSRQDYSSESRTTFVSTDPKDYLLNRKYQNSGSNVLAPKGHRSKANGSGDQKSRSRSRSPRKSAEPVRIFTLKPGRSPSHMDTGRMYYYTASRGMSSSSSTRSSSSSSSRHSRRNTRSSGSRRRGLSYSSSSSSTSSSRSSSTSTSSSESIATRWMRNRSTGRGRSSSKYAHRNKEFVGVRPRPYSMGQGSRHHQGFLSTSSSSSSLSSSFSSSENVHARTWRIRRRTSTYSSTSTSSSSSSTISRKHHSSHKHRDNHSRVMRVITPR